jgi:membrane-associated protease RseP (regulator of RpoE activity)
MEPASLVDVAFVVVGSAAFALLLHEIGHLMAAGALGGEGFRVVRAWPTIRVEATLPDGRHFEAVFLLAGAIANVGAAAALWNASSTFALAAVLQLVVGALALLPVGESDGARLLALWRR